jgi:hypothetical protein
MQSKFQNKVVLPTKSSEIYYITSLNIFSVAHLQLGLPLIWTRVRSQLVLLYRNFVPTSQKTGAGIA